MKKLIMFVMVLMLCMGTAAKAADPVAFYSLAGCLEDNTGTNGTAVVDTGTLVFEDGGVYLDGATILSAPIDTCVFEGASTLSFWYRTTVAGGCAIGVGSASADDSQNGISVYATADEMVTDLWFNNAASGDSFLDDAWHHYAVVFDGQWTVYVDGVEADTSELTQSYDCAPAESYLSIGGHLTEDLMADLEIDLWDGHIKNVGVYDVALDAAGVVAAKNLEIGCYGPLNPLRVDPNSPLTVYETGSTENSFAVSLKYPPVGQGGPSSPVGTPYTITVEIDPNGGTGGYGEGTDADKDIVLLDGTGADNTMTLTFNTTNWNVPQRVFFRALNDTEPEPPQLIEPHDVGITITSVVDEPNLNGPLDEELNPWEAGDPQWSQPLAVPVMDNDQANILFSMSSVWTTTDPGVGNPRTGSVKLWEEPDDFFSFEKTRFRNIGITLQVPPGIPNPDPCLPPLPTEVKLQLAFEGEIEGDNFPVGRVAKTTGDPCSLPYLETDDPNGMIFTTANYDTPQIIKVWGYDDALLQVLGEEGEYPAEDGDELYTVELIATVIDGGGDLRYEPLELEDPEDPCSPLVPTGIERTIDITVEDNECGAFGTLEADVSNPYYLMDEA
ncbi:MAG: LamG domain-containing protein, partial [Planctomycetota bacterium]